MTILVREGEAYRESPASAALPPLTSEILTRFMNEASAARRTEWVRRIREWAREPHAP